MDEMLTRVSIVCVPACVRAFVCVGMHACVHVCVCVTVVLFICASILVLWSWTLSVLFSVCLSGANNIMIIRSMLPDFKQSTSKEHYSIKTLAKLLLDTDSTVVTGKREMCSTQPVQVPSLMGETLTCHLN